MSTEVIVPPNAVEKAADARAADVMLVRETLQKYQAAMRQMEVRFEVLDKDLSLKKNRNPIHHIESRVKSPSSIVEKLRRRWPIWNATSPMLQAYA